MLCLSFVLFFTSESTKATRGVYRVEFSPSTNSQNSRLHGLGNVAGAYSRKVVSSKRVNYQYRVCCPFKEVGHHSVSNNLLSVPRCLFAHILRMMSCSIKLSLCVSPALHNTCYHFRFTQLCQELRHCCRSLIHSCVCVCVMSALMLSVCLALCVSGTTSVLL